MGIDRTSDGSDANAETVEEKPDRRPSPPPDKPGTDGYPSHADSRIGAAAANDTSTQPTDKTREQKPETPQPSRETSDEQGAVVATDKQGASEPTEREFSTKDDIVSAERSQDGRDQTVARPESKHAAEPIDLSGRVGEQDQALDGQEAPRRKTGTAEADQQLSDAARHTESKAAIDVSTAANDVPIVSKIETTDIATEAPKQAEDAVSAPETQDVGRAGEDAAGHMREEARLEDVAETATSSGEAGDHPKTAMEPVRPDSPTSSGPVSSFDTSDSDTAVTDSAGTRDERLEAPADEAKHREARAAVHDATGEVEPGGQLMTDGRPLREQLDPAGADGGSNVIGDVVNERAGDRIVNAENDKDSRLERLRKNGYESGHDALETAGKATDRVHDLLARHPPTGHPETRTGPTVTEAPHHGIDTGNALAAAMMAGVLFGEGIRRFRERATRKRGA